MTLCSLTLINKKPLLFWIFCFVFSRFVFLEKKTCLTCQTSYKTSSDESVTYPDGGFVAVDPSDSQPGRQVKHILQNLFIELEVGELPLPFQRAQIYLVRGQILGEPKKRTR